MRITLTQDGFFPKREMREIAILAKNRFEQFIDEGPSRMTFYVVIETKPRIKRLSFRIGGPTRITVTFPRKSFTKSWVVKQLAFAMFCAYRPELPHHRKIRVYHAPFTAPEGFDEQTLDPAPPKPKKKAPGLIEKYEVCLAQVGLAQAKLVEIEKMRARAQKHLQKRQAEARKRYRALTKPLLPGKKLSDQEIKARIAMSRTPVDAPPE